MTDNSPNKSNNPLSPPQVARQFLEVQYDEVLMNDKGMQELTPVMLDGLISYPFGYNFPETGAEGERATEIILVDLDENQTPLGFGEISFVTGLENLAIKDKPYVAYTETLEAGQHQGLNVRRLKVMNELSKQFFGFKLHSDHSGDTEFKARASWDRLVRQGIAELYDDGGLMRYRFIE